MASVGCVLLLFLAVLHALPTSSTHGDGNLTLRCHPDQAATLLQLKKSFLFFRYPNALESWQDGTDCCLWEGVGCSNSSGHVTTLELGRCGLCSQGLDPAIFNLTSLQVLDLSMNNFGRYSLPANGFERLASLTHLNLSYSGFLGQIPTGIGKLTNLISLDLSTNYGSGYEDSVCSYVTNSHDFFQRRLEVPNFEILVANLSSLRELYLDEVDMSSSRYWCHALAKSLPNLRVLSLSFCGLSGPICPSLSTLHSLTVINLRGNSDIPAATFSEFFMDFLNLSVLQLGWTNLQGRFPRRIFESKTLRVLDLSSNQGLSGHVPNFSNASSLEIMMLDGTNFSFGKPGPFGNFKFLKTLGLDVSFVSGRPLSSLGIHRSLRHLELTQMDSTRDLALSSSWIGDLRNLTSLDLNGWNFSRTSFSSIAKLKSLSRLSIYDCTFTRSALSAFSNLVGLTSLEVSFCHFNGPIPSAIGNLTKLKSLSIDGNDFLGPIPSSIAKLKSLKSLSIHDCSFTRSALSAIGNLVGLTSLEVSFCHFNGPIPSAIGNLTKLKSLNIVDCDFLGPIPSSIGKLMNLRSLEVSDVYNNIGPLPSAVGNLSNLENLEISSSKFSGPIPYAVGLLKKLTSLSIGNSGFSGSIPNSISNLTRLIVLDLSLNDLNGELPASVFTIPTLQRLDINSNQMSGSTQDINMSSSRLVTVDLSANNLTGNFPKSFFQLASLAYLDIGWNNLVGVVDLSSFWRLRNLNHLGLSNNKLSVREMDGEDNNSPSTYIPQVTWLGLASCNLTEFPVSLAHLNQVSYLDLSRNRISGAIPKWIWVKWNRSLTYLDLSHNLLSIMQLTSYVLPFNRLETLDLSSNQLQGQIPMPSPPAVVLDYSNNSFSAVLPNFTLYLGDEFKISKNKISGHIPNSICDSSISVLDLSFNNFTGWIPPCLIEDGYMRVLILRENQFEGVLPNNIKDQCVLHTLDLNDNKIEGQLPTTLTKCLQLELLDVGNNDMVDTFPSWLRVLPELHVLVLRSNRFYGSMGGDLHRDDKSREYFSSLQILDLALNNFSGSLSPELFDGLTSMMTELNTTGEIVREQNETYYQDTVAITYKSIYRSFDKILTTLTVIDLSKNSFDGTIPESLGRLVSLLLLNMSGNAFTGDIPRELGGMTQLESLDLSQNQLSGDIPEALTNLTFLGILNLSGNQLVGRIPRSRQFGTFENSSFEGNLGLCGPPLSKPCGISPAPPIAAHGEKSSHVDVILFLFVGLGFGIGFAGAILMRWGHIREWFVKSARALRT
ncbi:hypothetical protein ACQJBY_020710 [Aegilops geniculata]